MAMRTLGVPPHGFFAGGSEGGPADADGQDRARGPERQSHGTPG